MYRSPIRARASRRSVFVLVAAIAVTSIGPSPLVRAEDGATRNGDVNCSGVVDLSDGVYILNWLFLGGARPCPIQAPTELLEAIAALEAENAQVRASLAAVEAERDEAIARTEEAETERDAARQDLDEARGQIATLEADLAQAVERISALEAERDTLRLDLASALDEVSALEEEKAGLQDQLAAANTTIGGLESSLASATAERDAARARVDELELPGCTDSLAANFDCAANVDDGSCEYRGCTDPEAFNYDPQANVDDGSCAYAEDHPGRLRMYTIEEVPIRSLHTFSSISAINNSAQLAGKSLGPALWDSDLTPIPLVAPAPECFVSGMNESAEVVGWALVDGRSRAVHWLSQDEYRFLDVDPSQAVWTQAVAINSVGTIAGWWMTDGPIQPVVWRNTGDVAFLAPLAPLDGALPYDINDAGLVAGTSSGSRGGQQATVWLSDGRAIALPLPIGDFVDSQARAITNANLVVGNAKGPVHNIGVVWDVSDPDAPAIVEEIFPGPGELSTVLDMNERGQVLIHGIWRPYLFGDGRAVPLEDLIVNMGDWTQIGGIRINDDGVIAGGGTKGSFQGRPFILRPTDQFYPAE